MYRLETDVLVVGGGPAGSLITYELSKLGYKVVLFEMKKQVEVPTVCGEYLPEISEIKDIFPKEGLKYLRYVYSLYKGHILNKTYETIVNVEGSVKTFSFKGFVIDRSSLINRLVKEAEDYGAKVFLNTIFKNYISNGDGWKSLAISRRYGNLYVRSKIIVGADGYPSTVSRVANLNLKLQPIDIAYAMSQRFKNLKSPESSVQMFFKTENAPGGYAWIIPRGGKIYNVGLGIESIHSPNILEYYRRFLKGLNGTPIEPYHAKPLPVGGMLKHIVSNGTVLLGDAAGMVMPTNGGGIFTAMMASKILSDAVKVEGLTPKALKSYERVAREVIGSVIDHGYSLRKTVRKLMYKPRCFKFIFNLLPTTFVKEVIRGGKGLFTKFIAFF